MTDLKSGGCLCNSVRYDMAWPPQAILACHCKSCQKQSGGPLSTIGMVPRSDVKITGDLKEFKDQGLSGGDVYRKFCGDCGSPVITDIPSIYPDVVFVKLGTLDDTTGATPSTHLFTSRAQEWFIYPDDVQKIEEQ